MQWWGGGGGGGGQDSEVYCFFFESVSGLLGQCCVRFHALIHYFCIELLFRDKSHCPSLHANLLTLYPSKDMLRAVQMSETFLVGESNRTNFPFLGSKSGTLTINREGYHFRGSNLYSRLSLSRIPRDSLKYFEISVPRHIRVERVRKTIN